MIREQIKDQIDNAIPLPKDVIDKMEYKTTCLGSEIKEGDKIIYTFCLEDEYPKLFFFTLNEMDMVENGFKFKEFDEITKLAILTRNG